MIFVPKEMHSHTRAKQQTTYVHFKSLIKIGSEPSTVKDVARFHCKKMKFSIEIS
jgi:hypothetical protein